MDRTADRLDIIELLHRYSWAMLDKDWAAWQACFAEGAHVDYTTAGGIAGTPAEAAAWLENDDGNVRHHRQSGLERGRDVRGRR